MTLPMLTSGRYLRGWLFGERDGATVPGGVVGDAVDPAAVDDERVRELRVLVDYRADLIKRRTMVINQLKAQLHIWLGHNARRPHPA